MSMGWGGDRAVQWRRAVVPWFLPLVVGAIGVAGIIASIVGEPTPACSALAPCAGPGVDAFGLFLGALLTSFVGVWFWRVAGTIFGIVAATIDVFYDPSPAAHMVFVVYAIACLALLGWLHFVATTQRMLAAEAVVRVPSSSPRTAASGATSPDAVEWILAVVALVVILGGVGLWGYGRVVDAGHRARATVLTGVVSGRSDDDLNQEVTFADPSVGKVKVSFSDDVPIGQRVTVAIDRSHPTWAEATWDRKDHSGWLILPVLGAGYLAWFGTTWWRRRQGIAITDLAVPVDVRVRSGMVLFRPVGESGVWGEYPSEEPSSRQPGSTVPTGWVPGYLYGDVRDGGWALATAAGAAHLPRGPLVVHAVDADRRSSAGAPGSGHHGTSPLRRRGAERRWFIAKSGFWLIVSLGFLALSTSDLPKGWDIAHGAGVPGTVTITVEDCGGKSCSYSGDFTSDDGRYHFADVPFDGDGTKGEQRPGIYLGQGEQPDTIYVPGWSTFVEPLIFAVGSLGVAIVAALFLVVAIREP